MDIKAVKPFHFLFHTVRIVLAEISITECAIQLVAIRLVYVREKCKGVCEMYLPTVATRAPTMNQSITTAYSTDQRYDQKLSGQKRIEYARAAIATKKASVTAKAGSSLAH